jgi:hypothetical protein
MNHRRGRFLGWNLTKQENCELRFIYKRAELAEQTCAKHVLGSHKKRSSVRLLSKFDLNGHLLSQILRCILHVAAEGSGIPIFLNSLTAIRVLVGTKNSRPVGFYSRNSTKSTVNPNTTIHKYDHHGGAVCPSYGVGSMDPPNRTRRPSSKGVGRGGGRSE